jgi:hypothetical protein
VAQLIWTLGGMSAKNPFSIGPYVRGFLFFGVAALPLFVIGANMVALERIVGSEFAPYVLLGIAAVLMIIGRLLIRRVPPRLIIPIGAIGWVLAILYAGWYYDFGPGSFGHVSDDTLKNYKPIWEKQ